MDLSKVHTHRSGRSVAAGKDPEAVTGLTIESAGVAARVLVASSAVVDVEGRRSIERCLIAHGRWCIVGDDNRLIRRPRDGDTVSPSSSLAPSP